jgi:hypothetical protein
LDLSWVLGIGLHFRFKILGFGTLGYRLLNIKVRLEVSDLSKNLGFRVQFLI